MKRFFFFVFIVTLPALAQFTNVTGTVIDPNNLPYGSGTISAALVIPGGQSPTLNGYIYSPPTQPVGLNLAGAFLMRLADNTILQPGGTQWTFTVCSAIGGIQPSSGKGPVCFSVTLTISGASQDISAQLQAAALPLSNIASGGGGTPGGLNTQIQINNSGAFGGLANAASGSALVSQGLTTLPAFQQKPIYDIRDWGFTCNGTADNSAAATTMLAAIGSTPATVQITQQHCGMYNYIWPANVVLDFSAGGTLKPLTDSVTVPGNGVLDSTAGATGQCQTGAACNSPSNTFSITFTAPAQVAGIGDSYGILCGRGFSSGAITITSNLTSDVIIPVGSTSTLVNATQQAWYIPNVVGGSHTLTATAASAIVGACSAIPISGLGPVPVLDTNIGICSNVSPNSPYACSASFTGGSFLLFAGSQNNTSETCGTVGGGFAIVPGAAGCSTASASNMGVAYQASAAGGTASPTIAFSPSPAGHYWAAMVFGLRPGSATEYIRGGINNPLKAQIFENAAGAGAIDFTYNLVNFDIYPEWWGAGGSASATTNTAALQAAEHGAFGTARTNGSNLSQYNKPLVLDQNFQINNELTFYDVLNFKVRCDRRLSGGITQTASNKRIINGQSIAYGSFDDCVWAGNTSSTTWLIGLDYDGVTTPGDLAPQFIDFNRNTFNGNGVVSSGVAIAPSGGAAQGSNIYCWNCEGESFTFAVWQIGTTTAGATNAIDIGWYGGDMEGNPQYGLFSNAGGHIFLDHVTMENGFSATLGPDNQTGFDMFCENQIGQEPCEMNSDRSESRRLISAGFGVVRNSYTIDQSAYPTPGTSQPVGTIVKGSVVGGDGQYYKVTVDSSAFSGAGAPTALLNASGGSSTTLNDTNYTVAGSVTNGGTLTPATFTLNETVTQATSGSTATIINVPQSTATVTGSVTSGTFTFGENLVQTTTGATGVLDGTVTGSNNMLVFRMAGAYDGTHTWVGQTSGAVYTPTGLPTFAAAVPTMLITTPTGTPDATHAWTGGTSGAVYTPSGAPTAQVNWTANAFNGMRVSVMGGTGVGCYGVVTSNTATQVTFTAGFVGVYNGLACTTPDTTSTFLVEPGWNGGTVVSGGITMAALNEKAIDGSNGNVGMQGILENVTIPGDQVNVAPTAYVKNLQVTRPDWLPSAGGGWWGAQVDHDWDVHLTQFVTSPASGPTGANTYYRNWQFPNAALGTIFKGPQQRNLGTVPLVWSCGFGGGLANACSDVWIGGRSDPFATNVASRNVLEFGGYLGRATPTGVNQNGTDTDIQGGLPTGSGTPGNINLRCAPGGGSSGSAVQTSNICAKVTPSGVQTASGTPYTTTPWVSTAVALDTNAISNTPGSNCDTTTVTATGVVPNDVIECGAQGSLTGITGYVPSTTGTLTIFPPWAGTNQVFIQVCNQTSTASITPGAVTLSCHDTK